MLLSIATQLFTLEKPIMPAKKVPTVKTSKMNKGWMCSESVKNLNISDGISKYKRNKPIQIKEQIKDHRLMLCFIAFSYVIKMFLFNFNGK